MTSEYALNRICKVSDGTDLNRFVGVKLINGIPEVWFPLGYNLSSDEDELRNDVILLVKVLKNFYNKEESSLKHSNQRLTQSQFPFLAYQRMILRYLNYGNYNEFENTFVSDDKGKINWARTIKNKKPLFTSNGPVYTEYIVKKSQPLENSLIAEIYQYCVYCSFKYIGWLYTQKTIKKPKLKFNKKLFTATVRNKLNTINTDSGKELFTDMLTIIDSMSDEGFKHQNFLYGTYAFEYVWEKLIDYAFGIKNKKDFFPKSYWHIPNKIDNHALEPDTILIKDTAIYLLDAKYYRFGVTGNPKHLPETSSIHKQITYGEYIDVNSKFKFDNIYNAFLMPSDLKSGPFKNDNWLFNIGYASSGWKDGNKSYEKILGILIDTKYLMKNYLDRIKLTDEIILLFK